MWSATSLRGARLPRDYRSGSSLNYPWHCAPSTSPRAIRGTRIAATGSRRDSAADALTRFTGRTTAPSTNRQRAGGSDANASARRAFKEPHLSGNRALDWAVSRLCVRSHCAAEAALRMGSVICSGGRARRRTRMTAWSEGHQPLQRLDPSSARLLPKKASGPRQT